MSKTKSPPKFRGGDAVRVKPGLTDPDFPDIPFGVRSGTISQIANKHTRQ
jgi:hypothetical protein